MLLRALTAIALTTAAKICAAAWIGPLVGYQCDAVNDRLVIDYEVVQYSSAEAMIRNRRETQWSPDELIETMIDEDHIGELRTIEAICLLKHAAYFIRIGPTPGNMNIQGSCGAIVSAWIEVRRGTTLVTPRYELEGDCHDMEGQVTTELVYTARRSKPMIKRVPRSDF